MNHLTNFYKNKSEQLLEQIQILENKLKNIIEQSPPASVFVSGEKGQPAFSDEQLRDQMRANKRTNLFGPAISDDKQSQAYRDAQAELNRRTAAKNNNSVSAAPARTQPQPQPQPQTKSSNLSTSSVSKQNLNIPYYLARDPNVPAPPTKGKPAPVSDTQKGVPAPKVSSKSQTDTSYDAVEAARSRRSAETKSQPSNYQGGPNSDFAAQQRAEMMRGMVQDTLGSKTKIDTSFNPSLFGGSQPKNTTNTYDPLKSAQDLTQKTANLLNTMGRNSSQQKPQTTSTSPSSSQIKAGTPTPNKNAVGGGIGTGVTLTTGSEGQGGLFGFSYVPTKNGAYLPQQKSSTVSQSYFNQVHPGTRPSSMKEVERRRQLANTPQQSAIDALAKYNQEVADMLKRGIR
jgi:hypothetical protein